MFTRSVLYVATQSEAPKILLTTLFTDTKGTKSLSNDVGLSLHIFVNIDKSTKMPMKFDDGNSSVK